MSSCVYFYYALSSIEYTYGLELSTMAIFSRCVSVQYFQFSDRNKLVADMDVVPKKLCNKKIFIFASAVLILAIIPVIICYSIPSKQAEVFENAAVPLTSAEPFERLINQDIDPCEDFYSFACGGWENFSKSIESSHSFITPFTILQDQIQLKLQEKFEQLSVQKDFPKVLNNAILFYDSCVKGANEDIKYSDSLQFIFDKIGGWPLLLGETWNETNFDWISTTIALMKTISIETAFGIRVGVDFENTSENLLVIKPPSLTDDLLSNFMTIFYCVVNGFNPSLTNDEITAELTKTIEFEQQFRNVLQSSNKFKNAKMTISNLQKEIPALDWLIVLQSFTNETLCPLYCLTKDDFVIVNDMENLKNAIHFIANWNGTKREIANFFSWLIIADLYRIIPGVFKTYGEHFGYDTSELNLLVKKKCYGAVQQTFNYALDYLFIKTFSYFDINESSELVEYSKNAFRRLIIFSNWLDKETKSKILSKLDFMSDVIGYPNSYFDKNELDELCERFPNMTDDVIFNYVESSKYFINTGLFKLRYSNSLANYDLPRDVTHVSAYYDLNRNVIVFPLSIQYPPFYYFKGPWYLNFGAIGSMIGHEINHAFDNLGHMYDERGNRHNWWSNKSIKEFDKRLSCFTRQFDAYSYEFQGILKKVNGTRTIGENMADSSGLRQAFLAYKLWEKEGGKDELYTKLFQYNQDQMFFISFGSIWCSQQTSEHVTDLYEFDLHSPPKLRVNGAVSNSYDFARVFKCSSDSAMNPKNKCLMW